VTFFDTPTQLLQTTIKPGLQQSRTMRDNIWTSFSPSDRLKSFEGTKVTCMLCINCTLRPPAVGDLNFATEKNGSHAPETSLPPKATPIHYTIK